MGLRRGQEGGGGRVGVGGGGGGGGGGGRVTLSLPQWSISNFSCSLTRNITSHSMENSAFYSLLRWKMIITPILTTSLINTFSLWEVGRMYSSNLGVKGLIEILRHQNSNTTGRRLNVSNAYNQQYIWPQICLNPFTPKSDQCPISPTASPEILHHTVWRTWLFIAFSDGRFGVKGLMYV